MPTTDDTPAKRALTKLLKTVEKGRKDQIKRTQDVRKDVLALWAAAGLDAESSSTPDQVIGKARAASATAISKAWDEAEAAARRDSARERRRPATAAASRAVLDSILNDVIQSQPRGTTTADKIRSASRSWSAAAATAAARAYNETHAAQSPPGQRMVWVTAFRANTCSSCAALHGSVVNRGNSFDGEATLGARALPVYGTLDMPPRHPNCGCRLVPISEIAEPATSEMRGYANAWASRDPKMAPSTRRLGEPSETAKTTQMVTSGDIRALPQAAYDKLKKLFRAAFAASGIRALWSAGGNDQNQDG